MKKYKYLRIRPYVSGPLEHLEIVTMDKETLEALLAGIRQVVGGEFTVVESGGAHKLSRLRNRDSEVYSWAIDWLCMNGWEPYAVTMEVRGGVFDRITSREAHHFRKEVQ